jgi:hypothetical protein
MKESLLKNTENKKTPEAGTKDNPKTQSGHFLKNLSIEARRLINTVLPSTMKKKV